MSVLVAGANGSQQQLHPSYDTLCYNIRSANNIYKARRRTEQQRHRVTALVAENLAKHNSLEICELVKMTQKLVAVGSQRAAGLRGVSSENLFQIMPRSSGSGLLVLLEF